MSDLYVSDGEARSLMALDLIELERRLDEARALSTTAPIASLGLGASGPFVAAKVRRFEQAVRLNNVAKAPRKRSETSADLMRAAMDLYDAVRQMKSRVEEEAEERRLFEVDEMVLEPRLFTSRITTRVTYRYRTDVTDRWQHGAIVFTHEMPSFRGLSAPSTARKPSRARQEEAEQDRRRAVWESLRAQALQAVREYLRSGRDRAAIPQEFRAIPDRHSGGLNNYSTLFWRDQNL
jgi:hypothetical protein